MLVDIFLRVVLILAVGFWAVMALTYFQKIDHTVMKQLELLQHEAAWRKKLSRQLSRLRKGGSDEPGNLSDD